MPEQLKSGADYYLNIHVKTKEDSDWAKAGSKLHMRNSPLMLKVQKWHIL